MMFLMLQPVFLGGFPLREKSKTALISDTGKDGVQQKLLLTIDIYLDTGENALIV